MKPLGLIAEMARNGAIAVGEGRRRKRQSAFQDRCLPMHSDLAPACSNRTQDHRPGRLLPALGPHTSYAARNGSQRQHRISGRHGEPSALPRVSVQSRQVPTKGGERGVPFESNACRRNEFKTSGLCLGCWGAEIRRPRRPARMSKKETQA
jgi:hypothetical protein